MSMDDKLRDEVEAAMVERLGEIIAKANAAHWQSGRAEARKFIQRHADEQRLTVEIVDTKEGLSVIAKAAPKVFDFTFNFEGKR